MRLDIDVTSFMFSHKEKYGASKIILGLSKIMVLVIVILYIKT